MKRLATTAVSVLAALVVIGTAAVPADALTGFRRTIVTSCTSSGKIDAFNLHTGSDWVTPQPCTERVWSFEKQSYYYIYRPWTDFKAGDKAATHWYPDCYHELDTATDPGDGSYDLVYAFLC